MNILSRLKREDGGSYIIEFAVLALPMMTMLMGAVELGYMSYTAARVEGTVREVSRLSATGYFVTDESTEDADDSSEGGEEDEDSAPTSLELIADFVAEDLAGIPGVRFDIDVRSYQDFQDIQNPEPITQDADPIGGAPGPGDCFIDVTENGVWDANIPGSVGIGGSEDIVYFGLTV
ncbi:MAG: TadE/TadG family type IV pilus assembly protein, partial [Pacificimonas sp.]